MDVYVRKKGLSAAECLERSPRDLMGWIAERERLGYSGTTDHSEAAVEHFYAHYLSTLRPVIDARYPKAKALREPLQKLHCLIFDFMQKSVTHNRTYITHDRIAAYTEHVLDQLYSGGGSLTSANDSHPTSEEVAAFARLKAAVCFNNQIAEHPNYDEYSTALLSQLRAVEAVDAKIPRTNIRLYVVDFVYRYVPLLDPQALPPSD